jgi:MFS family permease
MEGSYARSRPTPMTLHREPEPTFEEAEEALSEGDAIFRTRRPGTVLSALSHVAFRRMWIGSFASNIGTWMQTLVLGAYAYDLTGSSAFVGLLTFAQLGPLLLLGLFGGLFADLFDRRLLLIVLQLEQAIFSLVLAAIVGFGGDPSRWALFACVFAIGIGNALNLPAWSAVLPSLVGRTDLPGAISLNSTQVNLSRVIGPAIAGVLYPIVGPSWIFVTNAATYLFVVAALLSVRFPAVPRTASKGWDNLVLGLRVARSNPVVGRILVTLPIFSFFCLPFIGLFPAIAAGDLDLDTDTFAYGALYACFGVGAAIGALSIGTVLAGTDKAKLTRAGLAGFAVAVFVFGLLRSPAIAYGVVLVLGAVYFGTVTAMMTVLQETLADEVRGRVMALWFMAFGGTIPLGALVFGPLLDATNSTVLLSIAGGAALALAWWCDLPAAIARSHRQAVA